MKMCQSVVFQCVMCIVATPFFAKSTQIANGNAKSQLADNQKDMPIFFAFLQFCKFLVSKQTNRGDGLHLIKSMNIH